MPKFFVRETFSVSLFPGTEKVWIKEGGVSRFSVGTLLSHSTEKLHRGILLCFKKYLVAKKFMGKRGGGGVSRFSVEKLLTHSAVIFHTGTF